MHPKSVFRAPAIAAALFAVTLVFGWLSNNARASQFWPIFDPAVLKGIDTIIVVPDGPAGPIRPPERPTANDGATEAVRNAFATQPWITVKDATAMQYADSLKPNAIVLIYNLSSRSDIINGKAVDIAALTLQFAHPSSSPDLTHRYVPGFYIPPRAYAFIVPHNDEEYLKTFDDAFEHLLSNLPQYFACGNQKTADACARLDPHYGEPGPRTGDPVLPRDLKKPGETR